MNHEEKYLLEDQKRQARLDAFNQSEQVSSLRQEIAMTRMLIEEAINANSPGLANNLLSTLTKLQHEHETAQLRAGELLAKEKILQLGQRMIDAVLAAFQGSCPDWEDRMQAASQRLLLTMEHQP